MTTTNLNVAPYYDDFDVTKGHQQILFKPGYAVQARELTQIQTILQNQISKFGSHVFKDGSMVLGGLFDIDTGVDCVKITDIVSSTDASNLVGQTIYGLSSNVSAYIVAVSLKKDSGATHNALVIRYLSSGDDFDVFQPAEQIAISSPTAAPSYTVSSTSKGSKFSITDGVVFSKGYFIAFSKQSLVLDAENRSPTYRVGFKVGESISNSELDSSLLDPAQGSYNYAAPGADRLVINLDLIKLDINEQPDADFILLFEIVEGALKTSNERTQYSRIYDEIAKRTYDESGDYTVHGLNLIIREHLNTGDNGGLHLLANDGDSTKLAIGVEPGLAYVKGYEVNNLVTKYIPIDKSTEYENVNSEIVSVRYGKYVLINEMVGYVVQNQATIVNLYTTAGTRVTSKVSRTVAPSGTLIGSAKVKMLINDSGTTYRLYLSDVIISSGYNFAEVRAVSINGVFFADLVLESGSAVLKEITSSSLIFPIGIQNIRNVKNESNISDTTFTFRRTFESNSVATAGTFTVNVNPALENHSYGVTGTLLSAEKSTIIVTTNDDTYVPQTGTMAGTSGTNSITGTGTFFTRLNVGDNLSITGASGIYKIATIATDTSLTLVTNLSSTVTVATYTKLFINGQVIDLNAKGSKNGLPPAVTVNNSDSLTIDLNETFDSGDLLNVSTSINCVRSAAAEVKKILKPSRYVKIDCSLLADVNTPINLGVSDLYKIRQIRKHTAAFTSVLEGADVTQQFIINDGQRDDLYEHASITARTGQLEVTDYLLIELDYFLPDFSQGVGYFSVESYNIDDNASSDTTIFTHQVPNYISEVNGITYALRDCLDFRPVKQNSAADATTVAAASINPAKTDLFYSEANGLRIPTPGTLIYCDYSYYLARRDVVAVTSDGAFSVIRGRANVSPITPKFSDSMMGVATIYIPPYPSIASTYARILNKDGYGASSKKITNARHTMRDIGVMKQRIENLEYYNSLSLLEKSAIDMKILDENGLDRFKNGFFIDSFLDHSLGNTLYSEYNIAVDKHEQVIRPIFEMESFRFSPIAATNMVTTGDLSSFPYTEVALVTQSRVTTIRNIEQSVFRFVGVLKILPDTDTWVDSKTVDKTITIDNNIPNKNLMTTKWGSWIDNVSGLSVSSTVASTTTSPTYDVWRRKFGDRTFDKIGEEFVGSFSSYAAAQAAAGNVGTIGGASTDRAFIVSNGTIINQVATDQTQTRTGTVSGITIGTNTEQIGTYVTDISIIPYIRPQTLQLFAQGLKANTKYYVFFDGEDMSAYCTQGTRSGNVITHSGLNGAPATEGLQLRSDITGELSIFLRLPDSGKRFRIGTKEIMITDNPTNSVDATSYAKSYFVASGLSVQKQNTIISTKYAIPYTNQISESRTNTVLTNIQTVGPQKVEVLGPSCMAYSFKVDVPSNESGVFLSSVDLFIKEKHPTLGIWFEIREMDSSGGITRTQVPYSEVWYKSSEVVTTNDATVPHTVVFPSLVFLMNDTQYAFIIHTEGLNPDYYFWISRLGETDIITNKQVTGRQLTGNVFTTNNNLNWDIVPDIDLKVTFNRANFTNTSSAASIDYAIDGYEFFNVSPPAFIFNTIGENIYGSMCLSLNSIVGGTIIVGDKIQQGSLIGNVLSINGNKYYTDHCELEKFIVGTAVTILDSNSVSKSITANITSSSFGLAQLYKYDRENYTLILNNSNGDFFEGCTLKGISSGISVTLNSFVKHPYSVVTFKPNHLAFDNMDVNYEFQTRSATTDALMPFITTIPDTAFTFDSLVALFSKSDEKANFAGAYSAVIRGSIGGASNYVSPIIDNSKISGIFINNVVNNVATNETNPLGGDLINKYVSQVITLAEDQDAEDLIVTLSSYIPQGTDVKVWARFKHNEDSDRIGTKNWIELVRGSANVYSSSVNRNNFISFAYSVPAAYLIGVNGSVQYAYNGNTFDGFKQFEIKIGLMSSDGAIVPRVADLQVIALQK
jgi:hypothetical protein